MASLLPASPLRLCSILITRAPRSARRKPAEGPDKYWLNSSTINPCKGKLVISIVLGFEFWVSDCYEFDSGRKFYSFVQVLQQHLFYQAGNPVAAGRQGPGNEGSHYS